VPESPSAARSEPTSESAAEPTRARLLSQSGRTEWSNRNVQVGVDGQLGPVLPLDSPFLVAWRVVRRSVDDAPAKLSTIEPMLKNSSSWPARRLRRVAARRLRTTEPKRAARATTWRHQVVVAPRTSSVPSFGRAAMLDADPPPDHRCHRADDRGTAQHRRAEAGERDAIAHAVSKPHRWTNDELPPAILGDRGIAPDRGSLPRDGPRFRASVCRVGSSRRMTPQGRRGCVRRRP